MSVGGFSMSEVDRWEVRVPKTTEWSPSAAAACMEALFPFIQQTAFSFHIRATVEGVRFRVWNTEHPSITQDVLSTLFTAYYPRAELIPIEAAAFTSPTSRRFTVMSRLSDEWFRSFTSVTEHKALDPLMLVSQTMQQLQPGEIVSYAVVV